MYYMYLCIYITYMCTFLKSVSKAFEIKITDNRLFTLTIVYSRSCTCTLTDIYEF